MGRGHELHARDRRCEGDRREPLRVLRSFRGRAGARDRGTTGNEDVTIPAVTHPSLHGPPSGGWRLRKGSLDMLLIVIRAVFVLVVAGLGVRVAHIVAENQLANPYVMFFGMLIAAVAVVALDL